MFNLFFIIGFAIVAAIVIAVLITRQKLPKDTLIFLPEEDYDKREGLPELTLSRLETLGEALATKNSLELLEKTHPSPNEQLWTLNSQNQFFFGNYVFGFFVTDEDHPLVTLQDIFKFQSFVKGAGATKGFFFTTGYFTRDVHQPLEGPKITFFNQRKVLEELKKLNI